MVTIIKQSAKNMNNVKSEKYGISPNVNEEEEEKSLSSQRFRTLFNFKRIERSKMYQVDLTNIVEKIT